MSFVSKHPFIQSPAFEEFNHGLNDPQQVITRLYNLLGHASDFFEIFIESTYRRHFSFHNGKLTVRSDYTDEGIGLRRIAGPQVDYVFINTLADGTLDSLIQKMRDPGSESKAFNPSIVKDPTKKHTTSERRPSLSANEVNIIRKAHDKAWARNWRVESVTADWEETCRSIRVINSDHTDVMSSDHLITLSVQAAFGEGSYTQHGIACQGGRLFHHSTSEIDPEITACAAVDRALQQNDAQQVPTGEYTVVLSAGACGIFIHEIIGHQLEADVYRSGRSCFSGRLGQRVAPEGITMIDDGTFPPGRGTSSVDDEGWPKQKTILIENGILKNLLHDRQSSLSMDLQRNGSARRENYAVLPMPRMSNTYLASGNDDPEELISSVRHGLYITSVGQGQADPLMGMFVFEVLSGFLIENGTLSGPVRPFTIMGNSQDTLKAIDGIGSDLTVETAIGFCVKDSQRLPVSMGMPTVRIRNIMTGGHR